jgi:putative transposase
MSGGFRVIRGEDFPYFVTCTVINWLPIFETESFCRIVVDSLNFLSEQKNTAVNAFVVMPSHLHAILWPAAGVHLSDVLRDFKRHSSRQISSTARLLGERGYLSAFSTARKLGRKADRSTFKVWQDGFHPEAIYSNAFAEQKINYIHQNPVRAGFAKTILDWAYTSAHAYYSNVQEHVSIDLLQL